MQYNKSVEYAQYIDYITNCDSLNRAIQNDTKESDTELGDFVEDSHSNPESMIIEDEKKKFLIDTMKKCLPPREFLVLYKRYGFEDGVPHTLEEIGDSMQITKERIRQVEHKALMRLKKTLKRKYNICNEGDL